MPANYVFVRGRTNAPRRRVYTALLNISKKALGTRSFAGDMDTILLLRCSDSTKLTYTSVYLRAGIPPAALREPLAHVHLTMGHTNKAERTRARAHAHYLLGEIF